MAWQRERHHRLVPFNGQQSAFLGNQCWANLCYLWPWLRPILQARREGGWFSISSFSHLLFPTKLNRPRCIGKCSTPQSLAFWLFPTFPVSLYPFGDQHCTLTVRGPQLYIRALRGKPSDLYNFEGADHHNSKLPFLASRCQITSHDYVHEGKLLLHTVASADSCVDLNISFAILWATHPKRQDTLGVVCTQFPFSSL